MNPASVSTLERLNAVFGNPFTAALVLAVVVLFSLLLWSQTARLADARERLTDARELGAAASKLATVLEANSKTIEAAVAQLGEASDAFKVAFELTGKRRRREQGGAPDSTKGVG